MKNISRVTLAFVVLICVALLAQPLGLAKGKGKEKQKAKSKGKVQTTTQTTATTGSRPPGWDRGRKTGWRGGKYPPGWSKWSEKEQIRWTTDREEAHADIQRVMVTYNIPQQQQSQIRAGFDEAILGGLAVANGANKLINGLKDPNQRKLFMINTTQNVLEYLK